MTGILKLDERQLLRQHGIRPRRSLGQNFLHDERALLQIVAAAELSHSDHVLEVGCGLGSLTRHLAAVAGHVVAVEIDPKLAELAGENLRQLHNVNIVCADMLGLKPLDLDLPPGFIVAANIPYYLTSALIRFLLESNPSPRRLVLTVQKQVAERICAEPPDMSILAVSVEVYGKPRIVADIPAAAFIPVPKVDSAVVRIDCHEQPRIPLAWRQDFFRVLRAGFNQPRKMLRNSLSSGLSVSSDEVQSILRTAGIDPRLRPQALSVEDWIRVSRAITSTQGSAS